MFQTIVQIFACLMALFLGLFMAKFLIDDLISFKRMMKLDDEKKAKNKV